MNEWDGNLFNTTIGLQRSWRSVDEIAAEYDLTLADIYAALAYYFDHRKQIDQDIEESKEFVKMLQHQTPSKLRQKLKQQTQDE